MHGLLQARANTSRPRSSVPLLYPMQRLHVVRWPRRDVPDLRQPLLSRLRAALRRTPAPARDLASDLAQPGGADAFAPVDPIEAHRTAAKPRVSGDRVSWNYPPARLMALSAGGHKGRTKTSCPRERKLPIDGVQRERRLKFLNRLSLKASKLRVVDVLIHLTKPVHLVAGEKVVDRGRRLFPPRGQLRRESHQLAPGVMHFVL